MPGLQGTPGSLYNSVNALTSNEPLNALQLRGPTYPKSDQQSILEEVFGKLDFSAQQDILNSQHKTHDNLPDALFNRPYPQVALRITGLLTRSRSPLIDPQIGVLPFKQMSPDSSNRITWNQIHFDEGLAPHLAEQGVPRLLTSTSTRQEDKLVRRGLAAFQEATFYKTKEGRDKWNLQILQIATAVQKTMEMDAIMALLEAWRNNPRRGMGSGRIGNGTFLARLEIERDLFGLVNKTTDSRGVTVMNHRFRVMMKKSSPEASEPDTWIFPENMRAFMKFSKDDNWYYDQGGPIAMRNRGDNVIPSSDGISPTRLDGMRVIDLDMHQTSSMENHSPSDLLTNPRQVGNFYFTSITACYPNDSDYTSGAFASGERDIKIFNEDNDRFETVRFDDLISNSHRFSKQNGGQLSDLHHLPEIGNDLFRYPTNPGNANRFRATADERDRYSVCVRWGDMQKAYLTEAVVTRVLGTLRNAVRVTEGEVRTYNETVTQFKNAGAIIEHMQEGHDEPDLAYMPIEGGNDDHEKRLRASIEITVKKIAQCIPNTIVNLAFIIDHYKAVRVANANAPNANDGDMQIDQHIQNVENKPIWNSFLQRLTPFDQCLASAFLLGTIDEDNMLHMHRNNVFVPVDFLVMRPWQEFAVSSAIVCKSGSALGHTYAGFNNFAMTSNIAQGTVMGAYVLYTKAMVHNANLVYVAENVFIQNYIGGRNNDYITDRDIMRVRDEGGLFGQNKNSLLVYMVPCNSDFSNLRHLDIRGQHEHMKGPMADGSFFPCAGYYRALLDIEPMNVHDPTQSLDFEEKTLKMNTICFSGAQEFGVGQRIMRVNSGHLGKHIYTGCAETRRALNFTPLLARYGSRVTAELN